MPYVKIKTNTPLGSDRQQTLLSTISRRIADALNKPERYVMVEAQGGTPMIFAGSDQPAAYVEVKSIGLTDSQTQPLSQVMCELLQEAIGIPPERVYIEFLDIPRKFWGWNGSTF